MNASAIEMSDRPIEDRSSTCPRDDADLSIREATSKGPQDPRVAIEPAASLHGSGSEAEAAKRRAQLRRAYRKTDVRLVAWYALVSFVMRISERNITNVAILNLEQGSGIKQELGGLSSAQWAWVLSVFYYPYILAEPVSVMLLKHYSPRLWMSRIMITWGIISMCQSAVQNFAGLMVCRALLGFAEAGFYPAVLFHLSFWYPAGRLSMRIAALCACAVASGVFSGLLAFAISFLDGAGGLAGWRYVFLIEGAPALLFGLASLFLVPDYPRSARFLTREEQQLIVDHLPQTQPNAESKTWDWGQVKKMLRDPTVATFSLIWACHAIGGHGVFTALPTVIFALQLQSTAVSQLMTMPGSALTCIAIVLLGWALQKKKLNPWVTAIALETVAAVCYIVLLTVHRPLVQYLMIVLSMVCTICVYPVLWPERIRAAHGTTTTGLAIGITNACAQFSGIIGPQVYQSKFGPSYHTSYVASIVLLGISLGLIVITWAVVRRRDAAGVRTPEK